jgi:hypothetical protein
MIGFVRMKLLNHSLMTASGVENTGGSMEWFCVDG